MNTRFSIKSNTVESDKIDNKITQFFVPSSRHSSPVVITPTDPSNSGTLTATITYGDLIASDNIYINTNNGFYSAILTLPPVSQILDLFQDPVQGSTRSWNIGYDTTVNYNIVSPDVISYHTGLPVQLFQNPQNIVFTTMTITIYPYGVSSGQIYDIFATSASSLSNLTVDLGTNVILGNSTVNRSNLGGYINTIIGYNCTTILTNGVANITIGSETANSLTTGNGNIIVGTGTANSLISGNGNVIVGGNSGNALTTGYGNLVVGGSSGNTLTTSFSNVILGNNSGDNITTGSGNTLIGDYCG